MPRAHILINLVIGLIASAPSAIKIFGVKYFFVGVGVVAAGLALHALHRAIRRAADRHADRSTVRRLLAQKPGWSGRDWPLPAPESYMLLQDIRRASKEAFKLGLLHLVAAGVLRPDKWRVEISGTRGDERMLRPGPRSKEAVTGSVASIYTLWAASPQPTIKDLARRAKQAYGSLDGFGIKAVLPELVNAGLYSRNASALTPEGKGAREELERRLGSVLRQMQMRRGSWIDRKPSEALMAAVVAITQSGRMPPEETELQLLGKQVERASAMQHDASARDIWFDWNFFNDFDRYSQAMDSEADAGDFGGDGGGGDIGGGDD